MTDQTSAVPRDATMTPTLSRRTWSVLATSTVVLIGALWPMIAYIGVVLRYWYDVGGLSVWRQHWVLMLLLGIIAPLVVMLATVVHQKLSARRNLQVGSLSLPQLARVLSWVMFGWFAVLVVTLSGPMYGVSTAVLLVGLAGSAALVVVLTISGTRVQQLEARLEARRRAEQPQQSQQAQHSPPAQPVDLSETSQSSTGAFWFAVPVERHTEGEHRFVLPPGEWILALEDRGDSFLVQAPDGRRGVLAEVHDVERAR